MNYESRLIVGKKRDTVVFAGEELVDTPAPRNRTWLFAGLAILAAALIAAYFLFLRKDEEPAVDKDAQLPVVTVVQPGRQTVEGSINATGTLAARRALPVGAVGEGGRVLSVTVDQGQWVRKGQVLVVIDRSVQTQQARGSAAQIAVAQADARLAQANLDRAQALVAKGFVSKAEVDRLTANRDAAVARVRVAQATLGELNARTARLNIYAPASGLVLERNVEPGQTVGAGGTPLFTIAQGGEMELLARVGEVDLAKLRVGTPVEVTPVGAERSYSGQVWQIEPTIDPQDRQGTARVALAYAAGLRPGGFAAALIRSGTVVAPVLPESAIMSDAKGDYVYVVDGKNQVVRRAVVQGDVTAKGIVIASGLNGTERVILRAGGFVNPGEKIKPVTAGK